MKQLLLLLTSFALILACGREDHDLSSSNQTPGQMSETLKDDGVKSENPLSEASKLLEANPVSWSSIKKVIIIVLENESRVSSASQPFLKSLLQKGAGLTNEYGVTHPSQPNYFALVAGQTFNASNSIVNLSGKHIGDLFDAKKLSWKSYAENYPRNCFLGSTSSGGYVRRHVPFISFKSVQSNPAQCAKVVSATQFFPEELYASEENRIILD